MMAKPGKVHVVPHVQGWAVKKEGNSKASSVFDTKSQAMDAGKSAAKSAKTELVEHNKSGQIVNSNSYGNDPCPPKDTKH